MEGKNVVYVVVEVWGYDFFCVVFVDGGDVIREVNVGFEEG